MAKAAEHGRAQYVAAGFRKIHLDCSMACAGDPAPLPEEIVAQRAAQPVRRRRAGLARSRRRAAGVRDRHRGADARRRDRGAARAGTSRRRRRPRPRSRRIARPSQARGLEAAWPRVIALVVQPGVEFDHHKVIDYRPAEGARAERVHRAASPQFVFEAHSTDYQTPTNLQALVRDHFAILKVGPGATYALARDAVGARGDRAGVARDDAGARTCARSSIGVMRADPRHWRGHYHDAQRRARSTCNSA